MKISQQQKCQMFIALLYGRTRRHTTFVNGEERITWIARKAYDQNPLGVIEDLKYILQHVPSDIAERIWYGVVI